MPVPFNHVPGNIRVPFLWVEFNAGVQPYQSSSRLLLIGQKTSSGSATASQPLLCNGNEDGLFGPGSMAAMMYKIARINAPYQEIWVLPLADHGSGVAAAGQFTFAAPTINGELNIYIAGRRVRIAVNTSMTDTQVCAAMVAAINADTSLPVTAAVDGTDDEKANITAKCKGTCGNTIMLEIDRNGDEGPVAAVTVTAITAMASGATDPLVATPLANLGSDEYDAIVCPYTDSTNFAAVTSFLNDISGRWSPLLQLYGHCFMAKADTAGNLSTFGNAKNDQHITVMGYYKSPNPVYEWAAAYGAVAIDHMQDAPELSRPLQTLPLLGIYAPKTRSDIFGPTTRQTLYYDGIAGYMVRRDGTVCIDRAVTTYQTNPYGSPDPTWLDTETLYQNQYAARFLKSLITQTWGRAALRDDNPRGLPGVATPDAVKDTAIHGYRQLSILNVVENEEAFRQALIVERNVSDPSRLDFYLPTDNVNQFRVAGVNLTTFLTLPNPVPVPAA